MTQSFVQNWLHIVFSTKHRQGFFIDAQLRREMFAFLAESCKRMGSPATRVGGASDHVHILCRLSKSVALADLVKEIKRPSSAWFKTKGPAQSEFHWQEGYGAFAVSQSGVKAVARYIDEQEKHHHQMSFKEEFAKLLDLHEIEYDARYLWD